jgi:hypothetical protein
MFQPIVDQLAFTGWTALTGITGLGLLALGLSLTYRAYHWAIPLVLLIAGTGMLYWSAQLSEQSLYGSMGWWVAMPLCVFIAIVLVLPKRRGRSLF